MIINCCALSVDLTNGLSIILYIVININISSSILYDIFNLLSIEHVALQRLIPWHRIWCSRIYSPTAPTLILSHKGCIRSTKLCFECGHALLDPKGSHTTWGVYEQWIREHDPSTSGVHAGCWWGSTSRHHVTFPWTEGVFRCRSTTPRTRGRMSSMWVMHNTVGRSWFSLLN